MLSIIMLITIGNEFWILKVHAESLNVSSTQKIQIGAANKSNTQNTPDNRTHPPGTNDRLGQISHAIQDHHKMMEKMNKEFSTTESKINRLKNEIRMLEARIEKRNQVLKERVRIFQQSGGNMQYLDVLLGSTSFSDFINRVSAVATMAAADQSIVEQQVTEKKEYEGKRASLEKKLAGLSSIKKDLIGMQSQLLDQQQQYTMLKVQSEKKPQTQTFVIGQQSFVPKANIQKINAASIKGRGYISTVISVGNRYIGNSVYVFGGGRTPSDIAHGRFDCSGFVHWAFAQAGLEIGFTTDAIKNAGRNIPANQVQPGDLVFFDTYKKDGHVGIYIGNGKFIGSQDSTGVAIVDMTNSYWNKAFKGHVVRI
jgi:peptidoglycan hydrolase CwlO-like protein